MKQVELAALNECASLLMVAQLYAKVALRASNCAPKSYRASEKRILFFWAVAQLMHVGKKLLESENVQYAQPEIGQRVRHHP